jgi:hypothetical protein
MFFNLLKNKKEILFFILLLTIFFYRSPHLFINGRFLSEEGSIYFAYAYKNNFIDSLFFIDFNSGYLNFWANISAISANCFDLLFAPLVSNYLSLVPKLLIIYVALYKKSLLFDNFTIRILFCLIVFVSPLNFPEIWFNSINSQIFFCILTFCIFLIKNFKNKIEYSYLLFITISGLTGVYSNILTPLFYFKYKKYKTLQDKYNFIFILSTSIVQFCLILYAKLSNLLYAGKIHTVDINLLLNYFYNIFFKTFFLKDFIKNMHNNLNLDNTIILILCITTIILILALFYSLLKENLIFNQENKFILFSLIYSFIFISILVIIGGVGKYVGGRYAALPIFFLLTSILFLFKLFNKQKIKYIFLALLIMSLSNGIYEFRPNPKNQRIQYIKYLDCIDCPNWKNEVQRYRQTKNYSLRIWPYPIKTMNLN